MNTLSITALHAATAQRRRRERARQRCSRIDTTWCLLCICFDAPQTIERPTNSVNFYIGKCPTLKLVKEHVISSIRCFLWQNKNVAINLFIKTNISYSSVILLNKITRWKWIHLIYCRSRLELLSNTYFLNPLKGTHHFFIVFSINWGNFFQVNTSHMWASIVVMDF